MALLTPVLALGLLVGAAAMLDQGGGGEELTGQAAMDFSLPDTTGGTFRLGDVLAERDALLYFSMGVGCDGCFLQIPEIAGGLEARDIELVSIMVGSPAGLAAEAERLGVQGPIVVDGDTAVSEAYGMLGQYGHADVPSHSFALVRRDGEIAWVRHYAEMFVPAARLFAELPA